jgi:hypothetical protein
VPLTAGSLIWINQSGRFATLPDATCRCKVFGGGDEKLANATYRLPRG